MESDKDFTIFCIIAGIILLLALLSYFFFKKLNKETLELYNFKVMSDKLWLFTSVPLLIFVASGFEDGIQRTFDNMKTGFILVCVIYYFYIMKKTSFKIALKSTVLLIPILIVSIPLGFLTIGALLLSLQGMFSGSKTRDPIFVTHHYKDIHGNEREKVVDLNEPSQRY